MNLLDTILKNPALVGQVAQQLNLDAGDAANAMQHMLPALGKGITNNMSKQGGLEGLLGALSSGNHQKYVDNPNILGQADSIADGNAILGHILGSKDVSRNVAGHASQATGVDFGALKKMLPMLATMVMGSLSKTNSPSRNPGSIGWRRRRWPGWCSRQRLRRWRPRWFSWQHARWRQQTVGRYGYARLIP